MANDFIKIAKGSFPTGSMSVYIHKSSTTDREIVGKVVVKLSYPSFVKGVWVKLVGTNTVVEDSLPSVTHDLFSGDEDHYRDGFHHVLIGFGDGDNCHGTYLELSTGRHSWPFYFKLPYYAPATYSDWKTSIRYKLIATFESPIIQSNNSRLTLNHEHVAPNYSNFLYVRLKETHKVENRELLQSGQSLCAQQEKTAGNHRMLPSIMHMIRAPTKLSIRYSPGQCVQVTEGSNSGQCAMFPFLTNRQECEILCSIENLRTRFPVLVQCELYSEVCTRSSPKHPFHVSYPVAVGAPNCALDVAGSPVNQAQRKPHSSCTTRLLWTGGIEMPPQQAEQVTLTVPIDIDTAPRSTAISAKPFPLPVNIDMHPGKIVQYSLEAPLYRHRTMLKVSVLRTDGSKQAICSPVFGEIYILPPKPESDAPITTAQTARSTVPTTTTQTGAVVPEGLPTARRPSSGRNRATTASVTASISAPVVEIEATVPIVAQVGIAALDIPTLALSAGAGADETMQPSPVLSAVDAQSYISPRPTSVASASAAAPALVPTRPMSGTNRAGRAIRNHGGVASFRAAHSTAQSTAIATAGVAVPYTTAPSAVTDTENQHPNTLRTSTTGRTPHAKPTKCGTVIRVDAEVLSRGPAAVLMDRSERRTEPIRTPQRFAVMYHVEVANAIDGTPIAIAPTPVAISTAEYRAVRRSLNMPTDTPEPPHLQGFQYYESGIPSSSATPMQVRRSFDSSFDTSNLEDVSSRLGTARRNSIGGIFEDDRLESTDQVMHFEGVEVAEEAPGQRQLFRETFNGIDYLASHTHLAIAEAQAAPQEAEGTAQGEQEHQLQGDGGDITVPNTQRSEDGQQQGEGVLDTVRTALVLPALEAEWDAPLTARDNSHMTAVVAV